MCRVRIVVPRREPLGGETGVDVVPAGWSGWFLDLGLPHGRTSCKTGVPPVFVRALRRPRARMAPADAIAELG